MTCAPSEDSDQPGHPPSLIRVFTVRMKKAWVLSYQLSANEDPGQTLWMPRLILSPLGAQVILLVLSCGGMVVCIMILQLLLTKGQGQGLKTIPVNGLDREYLIIM